ncbi:MAG: HNH endonuclease [Methanoculleus sp.]|nr:HNH endonuclease [Methanoculleus sp.]
MTTEHRIQAPLPVGDAYITDEARSAVLDRQCHRCAGCNAPLTAGFTHFNLRQPIICGAPVAGNFEALCPFCHRNFMRRVRGRIAGSAGHRNK